MENLLNLQIQQNQQQSNGSASQIMNRLNTQGNLPNISKAEIFNGKSFSTDIVPIGKLSQTINELDFIWLTETLTASFGIKYNDATSANYMKVKILFEILTDEGYSKDELRAATKFFIKNCFYPTWTPAEFLKYSRPYLYSKAKCMEMTNGTKNGFKPVDFNGTIYYIEENQPIIAPLKELPKVKYIVQSSIPDYDEEPTQETLDKLKLRKEYDGLYRPLQN